MERSPRRPDPPHRDGVTETRVETSGTEGSFLVHLGISFSTNRLLEDDVVGHGDGFHRVGYFINDTLLRRQEGGTFEEIDPRSGVVVQDW